MSDEHIGEIQEPSEHRLELRNLVNSDYADIKELQEIIYPNVGGAWQKKKFGVSSNRISAPRANMPRDRSVFRP